MENKFMTFIKSYLSYIDSGNLYRKPFSSLYALMAIINLAIPIYVFYQAVENNIFDSAFKVAIVFLLDWVIIAFASWISFQIWWDRKSKVAITSSDGDEFVATLVLSHLIQTLGEWIGTWIGIVGFLVTLITALFLGNEGFYLSSNIGLGFMQTGGGILSIILMPVFGFLIIVFTRFLAEQFRALSSIANNTRKN
jgi:hypothetical protein